MALTAQQKIRVEDAIRETEKLLAKEMAYSPRHQNGARIDEYKKHLAKLRGMLAES